MFAGGVRGVLVFLLLAVAAFAKGPARTDGTSWPALHGDLMRAGFYPEFPRPPLHLVWRKELWRELIGARAEVIVGGGLAFMGTLAGRLYAWDAASGKERWNVETSGPIVHSPALADGILYFGSMDRTVRALDPASGKARWQFTAQEGIAVSPCVWGGHVMFGDRAGIFYALDLQTGVERWRFETGAPILSTASISADGERVVFASEAMRVHCLSVKDGRLLWSSKKMAGITVRDYAPFIAGGLAIVATAPAKDFHAILGEHEEMLVRRTGFEGKEKRFIAGTAEDVVREQDFIVDFLRAHRDEQTFYAFRLSDGAEPWIAPVLYTGGMHNPPTPPCLDPRTGEVFVQLRSAYGLWDGGGEVRAFTCFGRLNLETGRVILLDPSDPSREPGRAPGARDREFAAFNYIGDETQALSCAPGWLFSNHQGFLGGLDLGSRRTQRFFGKRDTYGGYYGPGTFGWENAGGYEKAAAAGEPFALPNEWHGPARAIVSVANGRVYFQTGSQVLCLEGAKDSIK